MSLFSELQRRNVLRVAIAYLAVAWLLIQIVETLFPIFEFSGTSIRLVVILLAIGFPLVLIFSWIYELTPEGLMLERDVDRSISVTHHTGKKLDRAIIVVLTLSLGYFAFDKFVLDPARDLEIEKQSRQEGAEQAREEARLASWNQKSIAILPFVNYSERQEDGDFTNGMHDELMRRVQRIAALKVIARTSVMRYRDTEKSRPEIAKELSVTTILQGVVRRSGDQVQINVQLFNAHTNEQLWDDSFVRKLTPESLFAITSEISSKIAEALDAELSPAEESRVYDLPTASLEAYNHYMRGRQLMATRRITDLEQALQAFEHATTVDPDFALAWVALADTRRFLRQRGADYSSESMDIRKRAVDRALELDDQLGEAYVSLSRIYWETGKPQEAEAACNKAIELSPNYSTAYVQCGGLIGRKGPAFREQRLALYYKAGQLDPLSVAIQDLIGRVLTGLGRYDEALDQFNHLLQLDSDFAPTYASIGELHGGNGNLAEAIQWGRKALQRNPGNGRYLRDLARLYLILGDFESVARIREEMVARLDPSDWRFAWLDGNVNLAHGNLDELPGAFDRLPPSVTDSWWVLALKANTHLFRGDLKKARDYWLRSGPGWDDPNQWEELISANQTSMDRLHGCKFASILIGLGDEAQGKDLLRQARHFTEEILPGLVQDSHRSPGLGWCYLAAGSYDKALDFYEQRVAHGHIADWWREKHLPWWDPVHDHPRYIAMVNEIERMLEEQRELVRQMDEAGIHSQEL